MPQGCSCLFCYSKTSAYCKPSILLSKGMSHHPSERWRRTQHSKCRVIHCQIAENNSTATHYEENSGLNNVHPPSQNPSLLTLRSHVVHDMSRAYTHLSLTCRKHTGLQAVQHHTLTTVWIISRSHSHTQSGIINKSFHVLYCFKLTHLLFGESMQSRSILITVCLK